MQNGDIITTAMRKEISIVLAKPAIAGTTTATNLEANSAAEADGASSTGAQASSSAAKEPPYTIVNHGEV